MLWIYAAIALFAVVGASAFWRLRRRRRTRLISFVALSREPKVYDEAILARLAGQIFDADLGDGTNEGKDGFVVVTDIVSTISIRGRLYLLNSFPMPYAPDVEETANRIADLRIRSLYQEHRAWFSCDALGVTGATPAEEVLDLYQKLGKLFAELLDESCLLIYLPDSGLGYPINDDTLSALRSSDPIQSLNDTLTLPIVQIADDDPLLVEAVAKARETWSEFLAHYEAQDGEDFSVKAPIAYEETTEFIWISVTAIEGDRIYGKLGNDPGNLGPLKLGSKASVSVSELNDWCYVDRRGELQGGYTIKAVTRAAKRGSK